jgi:hypothetical protein
LRCNQLKRVPPRHETQCNSRQRLAKVANS